MSNNVCSGKTNKNNYYFRSQKKEFNLPKTAERKDAPTSEEEHPSLEQGEWLAHCFHSPGTEISHWLDDPKEQVHSLEPPFPHCALLNEFGSERRYISVGTLESPVDSERSGKHPKHPVFGGQYLFLFSPSSCRIGNYRSLVESLSERS